MDLASLVDPSSRCFRCPREQQGAVAPRSRHSGCGVAQPRSESNLQCLAGPRGTGFHRTWRRVCSAARPYRRTRSFLRYVRPAQAAGSFRLGRCQARGSCFSPPESGDGPRRAPRRAGRRLETPARQGIRRQIAQSVKRCRFVQPILRSPTFVTSQYADNITPLPSNPLILPGEVGETICKQLIASRLAASRRRTRDEAGVSHTHLFKAFCAKQI